MTTERVLDSRGEKCPLPVLRTEKALSGLAAGDRLVVLATDPIAKVDIPLFCLTHGHMCEVASEDGVLRFTIVRG